MDSAQYRVAAKRSKAGDSRAKVIKVQQHFLPTNTCSINKGRKEGLCLESDQKAHCYSDILSAEYDEPSKNKIKIINTAE
jgi:hypothetical protein